jgi:hypothetical protein
MASVIPTAEGAFKKFAEVYAKAAEDLADTLGIPADLVTKQKTQLLIYLEAFTACEQPNAGKVDREDRKEKRTALEHTIRKIKNVYIDGDPKDVVTNETRLRFGLPPRDIIHTPVEPPHEIPTFTMESGGYLQVVIQHPARPNGYSGAVMFYKVVDEPVTSHKELTASKLLTRIKETLAFEDGERLKTLYAALCWQNEKGELGPPSPIQSLVIV